MAKTIALMLLLVTSNEALKFLVFFPMPSKSHSILGHAVVNKLLDSGHEVVHVTSFPTEKVSPKLREVSLKPLLEEFKSQTKKYEAFKLKNLIGNKNVGDSLLFIFFFVGLHKNVFEQSAILDLLNDRNQKFDAVIVEWMFSDVGAGIAPLFQCPLIWYGSTEAHWQVLRLMDEIPNPSYNVDIFSAVRPPLSFWERVQELWIIIKKSIVYSIILTPKEKALYNDVLLPIAHKRGVIMPSYEEAIYNGSLLLLNSHPSVGTPYRLPQNVKYIGGHHVETKWQPLPKDLQKIMDEAKHGVIYFSMGSNLKSSDWPEHMKKSLLEMFGKLKQTVIWKFETDLNDLPSNVYTVKWAPQISIFNHPNLKLFITHGGQLSTIEAIHYGVQVIGIPTVGDQYVNMKSVVEKGFGIQVPLTEDLAIDLRKAIEEMLSNKKYKEKVLELSKIYHDRRDPGDELVYWTEHIVKTNGALHLRSPALSVTFYQKYYLDLVTVLIIILSFLYFAVRHIIRKSKKSTSKSVKVKKSE